ncbi:MAG TPA: lysophospholipid acyltransferase family protein [Pyrinomonadaceae bacterium]
MSETSRVLPREKRRRTRGQPEIKAMPQWVIEAIRPLGLGLSKVLWRTRYKGMENVPLKGGLIIAANHQTYVDPFWVGLPIKRPMRFLAWDEAFDWPVVGKLMQLFGAWPIQIEGSDPTAIRRSLQWLKDGGAVVIFPEGARCKPSGELERFKNGAVRLALEANVPILPVTIRGGHRVWPKGWRLPRLNNVEITYHPLRNIRPEQGEEPRACARRETKRLAEIIASAM